jgi:hypothetical protein
MGLNQKVLAVMTIVLGTFTVCWLPFGVVSQVRWFLDLRWFPGHW